MRLGWPQDAEGLGAAFRDRLVLEVIGHRQRDQAGGDARRLQPVLHHEVGGDRARARHRAQDRRGPRRHGDVPEHSRPGDGVHRRAPGPGRAARRPSRSPASGGSGVRRRERPGGGPADGAGPRGVAAGIRRRAARALLVEDERVVGELLAEFLALEGYEVDRAMDGREALELVRPRDLRADRERRADAGRGRPGVLPRAPGRASRGGAAHGVRHRGHHGHRDAPLPRRDRPPLPGEAVHDRRVPGGGPGRAGGASSAGLREPGASAS